MGQFKIIKHTGDVSVLATGATLPGVLASLAEGMFSLVVDTNAVRPRESTSVEIDANNLDELVIKWLNELLANYDAEGFLPKEFNITVDQTHRSLSAFCQGERFDRDRHFLRAEVKAATSPNLNIHHNGDWSIQVTLDV